MIDKEAKRSAGALYDLITPENKKLKTVGKYTQSRLVVRKGQVEHWLNGAKVVEYDIGSDAFNQLISNSKFKENPELAK